MPTKIHMQAFVYRKNINQVTVRVRKLKTLVMFDPDVYSACGSTSHGDVRQPPFPKENEGGYNTWVRSGCNYGVVEWIRLFSSSLFTTPNTYLRQGSWHTFTPRWNKNCALAPQFFPLSKRVIIPPDTTASFCRCFGLGSIDVTLDVLVQFFTDRPRLQFYSKCRACLWPDN